MRHSTFKKLAAAFTCVAFSAPSFAGMDALMQFTNLSPYTATVQFPAGNSDCWHDAGAQDGRIDEYFGYYRRSAVSDSSYKDYLAAYQSSTGVTDLATVQRQNMANTSATLAPAVVGGKAATTLFYGETSAALFEGCKLATSTRGFRVNLTDGSGQQVSSQQYIIQDPPGSQWTLSQMQGSTKTKTIMLGAGGHGNPWQIGITSAIAIVTLVSLGTATAELIAARGALVAAAELEAALTAAAIEEEVQIVVPSVWRLMLSQALTGGIAYTSEATIADIAMARAGTIAARMIYTTLVDGVLVVFQLNQDEQPVRLEPGDVPAMYAGGIDFKTATIVANSTLPDDRSVCVYFTGTLGIDECRLVGVSLTIMPNGTLVFVPMPGVGEGR